MTAEQNTTLHSIEQVAIRLTAFDDPLYQHIPLHSKTSPSPAAVSNIMQLVRRIIFPGFYGPHEETRPRTALRYAQNYLAQLYTLLRQQIHDSLHFEESDADIHPSDNPDPALTFINSLPDIKAIISTDVKALLDSDPAATGLSEVIYCYPGIKAILHHRIAHCLYRMHIPILPRMIAEIAHAETGIDIHPGAEIGRHFSIDHGTGVVIGQTAIIGNHVRLYQGVTLGAKRLYLDEEGQPLNIPRHPIIRDNVTIYSNTSVLGRITIGENSIIGGNIWLTHDVPPNSHILQPKAIEDNRN
jgi:serine O-acetyltransferase